MRDARYKLSAICSQRRGRERRRQARWGQKAYYSTSAEHLTYQASISSRPITTSELSSALAVLPSAQPWIQRDHSGGNAEFAKQYPGVNIYGGSEQCTGLTKKVRRCVVRAGELSLRLCNASADQASR